jgi:hypothetical protein
MLSEIAQTINWLLGLGLEARELSIGQTSLRAAVVFVLATAMIKFGTSGSWAKALPST